ncbi:DapH/DapD/GlmU-related protein [Adlercreutzia sp. ZJ473]|uniref:acyltransferase n=1 Tax=Adlercreutzia sp. ZJ473 TaxID=2722822 RepID=UPI001556F250|nr:acyltransferase [Adlercreutzia sp. ZJ473]
MDIKRVIKALVSSLRHVPSTIAIQHGSGLVIGKDFSCRRPKYVAFGKNISLGKRCRLYCYDRHGGESLSPSLTIGDNTMFGDDCRFLVADDCCIGNNVLAASYILITTENHGMYCCDEGYSQQPLITAPVAIEDNCWIGENVVVLPGVRIGYNSIIGAGSVVNKDIPPCSIAVGNPVRVIKRWDSASNQWIRHIDK